MFSRSFRATLLLGLLIAAAVPGNGFRVPAHIPSSAAAAVLPSFLSYSVEFVSFPELAGNSSHPNEFSLNLLNNIGAMQGSMPYIRVGGNTADRATYNRKQDVASQASSKVHGDWIIGPSF